MNEVTKMEAQRPREVDLKRIDRFPRYAFSASGHVISFATGRAYKMKGMPVGRYLAVQLARSDGTSERIYVHRAIAEAFYGPCPENMECRHLDGNPHNNRPENLAWGYRFQNAHDREIHKTKPAGEKHGMSKLTKRQVLRMREIRESTGKSFHKIAADFGVSPMTAHRAITKKLWREI